MSYAPLSERELDALEVTLLTLGSQELRLEQAMAALLARSRETGKSGDFAESDAAWEKYAAAKANLALVKEEILEVEKRLYRGRRELRK